MQKELKIGVAIGAVLLVVLIVYLAVPKGNDNVANNVAGDSASAQTEEQSSAPADKSGATPAKQDAPVASGGADQRPPVDPFAPSAPADTAKPGDATASNAPKDAAKEDAWAVLNTGQIVTSTPPLMVTGPKPTGPATIEPKADSKEEPKADDAVVNPADPAGASAAGAGSAASSDAGKTEPVIDRQPVAGGSDTAQSSEPKPEPQASAAAAATGARTHKVAKGETLSSIAKQVYGSTRYYLAIQEANPGIEPAHLREGQTINLPDADAMKAKSGASAKPQASAGSPAAADSDSQYTVKKGDNLHDIAIKRLGSAALANDIYELNKQIIGADSAKLKIGQTLKMPAKPVLESSASR